jgi:predicted porin
LENFEMKKSLIALAVLAASGAAMAQSTVTLYGLADVWLGSVNVDTGATSTRTTKVDSGGAATSKWGMMGSEDLGGGLKANFKLEQGLWLDTGTPNSTSNNGFTRQAYVGFSGDFGEVRMGHTTTPFDDVSGALDAVFDSDLSPMNGADSYGNVPAVFTSVRYTARPGNMIYYHAPTMGGFSGAVSYGLNETDSTTVGTSNTSLNLTYAAGPLAANFGYQVQKTDGQGSDVKFTRLSGSYNFGVATAKVVLGSVKNASIAVATALTTGAMSYNDGASTSEYLLGVDVPVSAALTVSAAYADSTDNGKAGDTERSGYSFAALYSLSKRTALYGGYKAMKYDFTGATADVKVNIFALGILHKF